MTRKPIKRIGSKKVASNKVTENNTDLVVVEKATKALDVTEVITKRTVGRPLKYQSVEELQVLIDGYFKECDGKILYDEDGKPVLDKKGEPVLYDKKPYVITGLGLALGMSRQGLINYNEKSIFFDAITHAKQKCELYAESCLFTNSSANGPSFNLKNNYGWKDKVELEQTTNIKYSKLEDFFV